MIYLLGCQSCCSWLLPSVPPEAMAKWHPQKSGCFRSHWNKWYMKLLCLISQGSLQAVVSLSCIPLLCSASEHHPKLNRKMWWIWWIENIDLKLENSHLSPCAPQSSPSPHARVHHSLANLSFPFHPAAKMRDPLCTASSWEQTHIAWTTKSMVNFGGISITSWFCNT